MSAGEPTRPLPVVLLMGPTASGKTDAAVALVEQRAAQLISVDSALVYRGMDIGTAKPDADLQQRAPHRLIDIREPEQSYSAAEFLDDACAEILAASQAERLPVLVGGTMMYFHVLQHGIAAMPAADPALRERLEQQAAEHGWAFLHKRLTQVDPVSAARIHYNDPQRIQRALEVWELTGQPISALQQQTRAPELAIRPLKIALCPSSREVLHERIEQRFDAMMVQGFMDEMQALRARGTLTADLPAMRSVGYRQAWRYLEGEIDQAEMRRQAIVATRQLAKRQLTWLRREADMIWIDSTQQGAVGQLIESVDRFLSP